MTKHSRGPSRRDFLQRSAQSSSAIVLGAALGLPSLAADNERFELSIHQYSLKPLFDTDKLVTADYPAFVHENFGFLNVEFAVEFCEELKADLTKADAIRKASAELGVKHRTLLCGATPVLDAPASAKRQAAVKDHLGWAEVAKRLGCEFIRVRASSEGDRDAQLDYAAEGIGALVTALQDSSVSVLIENIAGHSRDPVWLTELVQRIGTDRVGLIADFGNFEGDIYDGMRQLLPFTKSVCTKSWEFDAAGNETKIDFQRMMGIIKESRFRGCIAIEYLGDDPLQGVKQTANLVQRHS